MRPMEVALDVEWWEHGPVEGRPFAVGTRLVGTRYPITLTLPDKPMVELHRVLLVRLDPWEILAHVTPWGDRPEGLNRSSHGHYRSAYLYEGPL